MNNKLPIINLACILLFINALCQIPVKTIKKTSNDKAISNMFYDSTMNFLGDQVELYKGQILILKENNTAKKFGSYENFYKKIPKKTSYSSGSKIKYNSIAGKSFLVKDVINTPVINKKGDLKKEFFLKLSNSQDEDIVYYKYDPKFKYGFPFIVLGYFKKLENDYIGNKFILRQLVKKPSETRTKVGDTLKCTSFFIENEYFNLVVELKRSDGETVVTSVGVMINNYNFLFPLDLYSMYENKFGDYWETILNKRVKIGMTKEMAEFSWGKPKTINRTTVSNLTHEQWVYRSKSYLYFEGDTITSIQN